jgi:GntR family transcriptional regulator, transcriptional repressor for pyruvate dehydrogenase complex
MPETISRKSISEQIADQLRGEILRGEWAPGSRLPSEAELAQRFGTNRNTLREAIRLLDGLNLIHVRQGDGVYVRDFRQVGELSLLPHYLLEAEPAEKQLALEELLELRRFVSAEAAALAARRATDAEVEALRRCLATLSGCSERAAQIAADLELYRTLVSASHSFIYVSIFNTFDRVYTSVIALLEKLWVEPDLRTLDAVIEAVAARDSERARGAMSVHLGSSDQLALARLP